MSMRLSWMRLSVVLSLLLISPSPDDSYCSKETRTPPHTVREMVPSHYFSTTHTHTHVQLQMQMQLQQLEHQVHSHAIRIQRYYELYLMTNHHNTNSFTQIMDSMCMDFCQHVANTDGWTAVSYDLQNQNCPQPDCKHHSQYYGNIVGENSRYFGNLWEPHKPHLRRTIFKSNTEQNTDRNKSRFIVFACQMELFLPQDLFHYGLLVLSLCSHCSNRRH